MDDLEAKLLSLSEKRKPGRRKKKNVEEDESEDDQPELSALQKEMVAAERYEQQKDEQVRSRLLRQASSQKEKEVTPSREMRKRGSTKSSKDDQMNELRKRRAGAQSERDLRRSRDYMDEDEDKDEDEDDRREEEEEEEQKPSSDRRRDRDRKSAIPSLTAGDMNSIRLKRDSLDKWINEAYFDDIVKGFFVRVGMGISNGKRVYRVALIDEVREEKKRYKVVKNETSKVLVLKYGSGAKNFRIEFVSNQDFTQAEVDKWLQVMTEADEPILSPEEIKDKAATLKEFLENYRYTNEDVNKILEQKRKLKQIHRNLASEKISLCSIRDAMQENGEAESSEKFLEVMDRIQEVEREMEERKKAQQEGKRQIAEINKKNRGVNINAAALAKEEESKFVAAHARRKTNPTFMFGSTKKKGNETNPEDEEDKLAAEEKARRLLKNSIDDLDLKDSTKPSFSVNGLDLDFDFDIDVSTIGRKRTTEPLAPVTANAPWVPTLPNRPLRTLSVQEYKRRRGLI